MKLTTIIGKLLPKKIKVKLKRAIKSSIEVKDHPNERDGRLDLIEKGFANRINDVLDNNIFERIIESYNKAKLKQSESEDLYQVSNEWVSIYTHYMNEIIQALTTRSIDKVKSIYNNFFREYCSVGLHGLPVDMPKHYFSGDITDTYKTLFLNDFLHRLELWNTTIGKSFEINSLESPDIGNPYGMYVADKFIKTGSDYLHYYATMISRILRGNDRKIVLELGGGYGGMAFYLIRDNKDITYLDFDLPENLALTSFYLMSAFPDKRIALYGEVDLSSVTIKEYDIILMPNFEISKIKNDTIDLIFNSYSLAEMSREAVSNYIDNFNRIANKFIFHINHTRSTVIKSDDFNIDLNKFELLYRAPALWNLARNKEMDEFEYLFKNKHLTFK
jgi:putative sugar O-methyltransferase